MVNSGTAVLIDIREIHEFYAERIPGALLSPMQEVIPAAMPNQTGKRLILHCLAGVRTVHMAEALISSGIFTDMAHMEGGILAWKAAGLPTIGRDAPEA